ncbi:hypothetical protein KIW84_060401 [Lathyrus oleraceus]|uniref:SWIM-type domain-containing protein n=1 Tax=Pisum sativum TaxID=3888 RepID=A0A9D4W0V6_PEA|nr:hypothetical protein KIW84_060401 [Pisum sativum]
MVIEKNKQHAQGWTPTWYGDDDLSIFGVTNGIESYCVNLKNETCSCRKWDLSGIPCCHVNTSIWNIKNNLEVMWLSTTAIGSPKKLRKKENDELENPHVLSRRHAAITCKKYGEMGHNKRSYKGKRAVERAIPTGGNRAKKSKTNKGGKGKKNSSETHAEIRQDSQAPQVTQD